MLVDKFFMELCMAVWGPSLVAAQQQTSFTVWSTVVR